MSGFENASIILDEERSVYYAGQILSGQIEFGLSQPLTFKAITVEFQGEASVHWSEVEVKEYHGEHQRVTVEFSSKEQGFNVAQCVCGGVGISQLPAGNHSIPFRYQIPPTVPSSFNGSNGDVSYFVKVRLDFPDGRESVELEKAFEVVVPLDMNIVPEMRNPIFMDLEQVPGSCCWGGGPLSVQVRLPASGFCPGQIIPVEIKANNRSSVEVSRIIFEFVRRDSYHSTFPPSEQICPERSLGRVKCGAVLANTKRTFVCDVAVPAMIAPVLQNCRIIEVAFFLKVKLKVSGCNDDLDDEAQIYLGLVPLHDLTEGQYKHPLQRDLPKSPIPDPNALPVFIPLEIYPSVTLESSSRPVHTQETFSYPGAQGYPGNTSYPGHAPPYPGANTPYPGSKPPYPGANTPYPGANTPYPGYPSFSPQHPTNSPNPAAPPYVPGAGIGFAVPGLSSPGYPPGPKPGDSSPYNPSAPPAP